jgi:preprotein translocase subunit SecD
MVLHQEGDIIMVSYKIWILIFSLILSLLFISPWNYFKEGVEIKSLESNSPEFFSGLRTGMLIKTINSQEIKSLSDYAYVVSSEEFKKSDKVVVDTNSGLFVFLKNDTLKFTVGNIQKTKLKTGLDLSGGARALLRAENHSLTPSELNDLISITEERFNIYGLKDITVKSVKDLSGENYMLIEIAGATPSDLKDLVTSQGKFEGRIGNQTVFIGGEDITHVSRAQGATIEGCYTVQEGELCKFIFSITLTAESAKRHADITSKLGISSENPGYLSEKLDLIIDSSIRDSLYISKDLKGRATTEIAIQGSGTGKTRQEAVESALEQMKKLQTILITGSLPYKLEIVKLDTISPILGREFSRNIFKLTLIVFFIVSSLIFIRYRDIKISSAVILTMFSELFITLGIASLIKWNLDAASIAGIIAGMGTGVNDQIVITDEAHKSKSESLKERIKNAFLIILGAFFTIFAAMIPLFWAGAGMLKGFALTTIIGVSIGILITRPAFAEILKRIKRE